MMKRRISHFSMSENTVIINSPEDESRHERILKKHFKENVSKKSDVR